MSKLVVGCGYLGRRVAEQWAGNGHQVYAITRSTDRATALQAEGLSPIVADITRPQSMPTLPQVETVLYSVGYDRQAGQTINEVYVEGLENVLHRLPNTVERFIYISSTGVYGQTDGVWVDEKSECKPTREGGKACLAAEERLATHSIGQKRIILRLSGIYGPGRIPQLDRILSTNVIRGRADGHVNLIHVDDAVNIVLAAERHIQPPQLYVISDGQPVQRGEFYRYLVQLYGMPEPHFDQPVTNETIIERSTTDKRVKNNRLKRDLPIQLKYPSYREGLTSIVHS